MLEKWREKNSRKKLTCLLCASGCIRVSFIEKEDSGGNMKRAGSDFNLGRTRFSGAWQTTRQMSLLAAPLRGLKLQEVELVLQRQKNSQRALRKAQPDGGKRESCHVLKKEKIWERRLGWISKRRVCQNELLLETKWNKNWKGSLVWQWWGPWGKKQGAWGRARNQTVYRGEESNGRRQRR